MSIMSEMDVDQLIEEVRKRPHLWDRGNSYHSNRRAVDKSWREIAELMQQDEYKLRKKWRYLRDQFSVEYGKIPPGSEDEAKTYEPRWRFYKLLQFLEEVVTPRVVTPRVVTPRVVARRQLKRRETDEESTEESLSERDSPVCEVVFKKERLSTEAPAEKRPRKQRDNRETERARVKVREPRDGERAESEGGEEHIYFFRSLLPHVSRIPAHLQLSFRNKIQQVVEEFAYGERSTTCFITCVPDTAESAPRDDSDLDDD